MSYKDFPGSADMSVMARKLTHAITILLMLMPAVWGQSTPKKVSRAEAIAAISSNGPALFLSRIRRDVEVLRAGRSLLR